MNSYLEPAGFLGTGASLLADLALLAYVLLLVPGMLAGFYFARRRMYRPQHRTVMTLITLFNWFLILFLMVTAYRFDVAAGIGAQPDNLRYLVPTIHALFGLPAQLLATNNIFQMWREERQVKSAKARGEKDVSRYYFKNAKTYMRLTLALWLITAVLGVTTYLIRYEVLRPAGDASVPAATEEPAPTATELPPPAATEEPAPAATEPAAPAATEEPAPAATEMPEPAATAEAGS